MKPPTTAELPRLLARDLDRHFDDLVLAFQQPLYAYAFRMSGDAQDAEEIVQDVLIRAYTALCDYAPERIRTLALKAWLYRICINQVRNKRRKPRVATAELVEEAQADGDSPDPTAESYSRGESDTEMQVLIARLPAAYRTAVVLKHVNELSYPEIAEALDQPEGTVKSNVHRGLKLLRSYLEPSVSPGNGVGLRPGLADGSQAREGLAVRTTHNAQPTTQDPRLATRNSQLATSSHVGDAQ